MLDPGGSGVDGETKLSRHLKADEGIFLNLKQEVPKIDPQTAGISKQKRHKVELFQEENPNIRKIS